MWSIKYILFIILGMCGNRCAQLSEPQLRIYLGTIDNFKTTPLSDPKPLLQYMDLTKCSLFYAFGLLGSPTAMSTSFVVTEFLTYGNCNIVVMDWSDQAKVLLGNNAISYATFNAPSAEVIGCESGKAVVTLIENGLDRTKIIFMGHSLGGQFMGMAGRCAIQSGYTIPLIIGLDPAGPLYTKYFPAYPALDKTCAAHVKCIVTDPNGLGGKYCSGHENIYPNFNETYTMQPGCTEKADPSNLNSNTTCSHNRAWRLICAGLQYPDILPAVSAVDGAAWLSGKANTTDITYISINVTPGASGNYYCRTTGDYPYGLEMAGIEPQ